VNRRLDVYGALAWLAAQPGVDGRRLGVIGWSHGGQTVLFSADRSSEVVAKATVQPAMLVAFYPGCTTVERAPGYQPVAPLLVMSGALDNWTVAAPCRRLVQRLAGRPGLPSVEYIEFPDSYHGFDGTQPLRELSDVGGTASGRAMFGGNPAAREASAQALMRFVGAHLKP
jgi:dienelactone hydrolase